MDTFEHEGVLRVIVRLHVRAQSRPMSEIMTPSLIKALLQGGYITENKLSDSEALIRGAIVAFGDFLENFSSYGSMSCHETANFVHLSDRLARAIIRTGTRKTEIF